MPVGSGTQSVYDGDGYRVMKTVNRKSTLYWPSPVLGIIDESNAAGTSFGKQVYFAGLQVWSEDTAGTGKFLFSDHLGSTRVTANSAGQVLDDIDYLPYGQVLHNYGAAASDNHYTFTGYEQEDSSGTNLYGTFRNLQTNFGRYTRPDPYDGSYDQMDPQSLNRYAYVGNRPLNFVDPTGLFCEYYDTDSDVPGAIEEFDFNSSPGECSSTGGVWQPDGYGEIVIQIPIFTGPSSLGPIGNPGAPNNGTPWYKNPCVQSALAKGAASTAIDAVGLLPEGGAVAGAFSLWHGAAGVSNGIKILQRVKFGAGIISTASAGSDASRDGAFSLAGAQLATGFASIGAGLAKATPIVGQVLSGISVAEDLYGTYKAVAACHP